MRLIKHEVKGEENRTSGHLAISPAGPRPLANGLTLSRLTLEDTVSSFSSFKSVFIDLVSCILDTSIQLTREATVVAKQVPSTRTPSDPIKLLYSPTIKLNLASPPPFCVQLPE